MDLDQPVTIPGPKLAALRKGYGVTREDLARTLALHRNTLRSWETAAELDVARQRRYLAGLREIVDGPA